MRDILFRGKRVDNGEWVISDCFYQCSGLVKLWDAPNKDGWVDVIPETVGQYTGLTDKNGTKIFEGDIIREYCWSEPSKPYVVIMENKERCGWYPFASGDGCGCCEHEVISVEYTKIVGNIHDNPELIE